MQGAGQTHRRRQRALAIASAFLLGAVLPAQGYRAPDVIGLDRFPGSAEARALLLQQGFVAIENLPAGSDEAKKPVRQLFEAYIGQQLPAFVSVDLIVDALVYLLENTVRRIEQGQRIELLQFSRRLQAAASAAREPEIAELARIAILLQTNDEAETKRWGRAAARARELVVAPGTTPVVAKLLVPVGEYASSKQLAGYFRARRLYQECAFRRYAKTGERAARWLATLTQRDTQTAKLLRSLQKPWDELLGPPVPDADPCVLPARVTPLWTIADRAVLVRPTGLLIVAAGPLRSDLGTAIWKRSAGNDAESLLRRIRKVEAPDTTFGHFLDVLGVLSLPVDPRAPALFHRDAWKHKQVATQLGSWARLRHAFALQAKMARFLGRVSGTPGVVSPYPRVFRGLANIAEEIGAHLPAVDLRAAQRRLREAGRSLADRDRIECDRSEVWELLEARVHGLDYDDATKVMVRDLKTLTDTPPDELSAELRALLDRYARGRTSRDLVRLAGLCRRLAAIADEQLAGKPMTDRDRELLADVGKTVAGIRGYRGNAWLSPRDDHPHVVPVGFTREPIEVEARLVLNVGVARPDALYLILDTPEGPALYLGAMLSYRESVEPQPLTDAEWIARVRAGRAPEALGFTREFRR